MSRLTFAAVVAAFAAAPLSAALADRAPTAYENAEIGNVLFAAGYSSWGSIEWDDDGYWEIEDAIGPDGKRRDVKLDGSMGFVGSGTRASGGPLPKLFD